jgi:hypothetical protein
MGTSSMVYGDKDHTFLNLIRAFGEGHQNVGHNAVPIGHASQRIVASRWSTSSLDGVAYGGQRQQKRGC